MVIEISGVFPDGLVLRVGVEKNAKITHCSPDVDQQVIEVELTDDELQALQKSAQTYREGIKLLGY